MIVGGFGKERFEVHFSTDPPIHIEGRHIPKDLMDMADLIIDAEGAAVLNRFGTSKRFGIHRKSKTSKHYDVYLDMDKPTIITQQDGGMSHRMSYEANIIVNHQGHIIKHRYGARW